MLRSNDPVDSWVVSDGIVSGINENDFVIFVDTILTNPIAVQDSQSTESSTDSFFSLRSKVSGWLELVDTDGSGLTANDTSVYWSLSTSSSDSNSVDNIAVFGFVAEFSSLVGSSGMVNSSDDWKLSVLPGSDSHEESHDITLFLSPELFEIQIGRAHV